MIKNSLKTLQKHDIYTILERGIKLYPAFESFLSCSATISTTYPPCNDNTFLTNPLKSIGSEKRYRADGFGTRYGNNPLDGVSGPSTQDTIFILGIDPGITGAIAILRPENEKLRFVAVFDMPFYELKVSGKNRKRIDLTGLSFLLDQYSRNTKFAMIEDVGQVGTNADPFSAFVFGFATGAVHGALAMAGVKTEKVKPQVWKNYLGLDADKEKSLNLAIKLFPESQKYLKRKMDHGRAEAILMAWFAFKHMRKQ